MSQQRPHISLIIPLYYELHDLLDHAISGEEEFKGLSSDIVSAVKSGMLKYSKYYAFMDQQDAYHIALFLDPRLKTLLLEKELGENAGPTIQYIKGFLHDEYPSTAPQPPSNNTDQSDLISHPLGLEARVLKKLQGPHPRSSDIDRYFDEVPIQIDPTMTSQKDWLFLWWNAHKSEYPRMAAAARDYLAIPAAEVSVERLFSSVRDLLGVRRHSMTGETMRKSVLLRNVYKVMYQEPDDQSKSYVFKDSEKLLEC